MKPCKICGAIEYSASLGGPGICPKCDCGVFDAHTLAWHNNRLSTELAALRSLVREIVYADNKQMKEILSRPEVKAIMEEVE
jgi:hypothetical protein